MESENASALRETFFRVVLLLLLSLPPLLAGLGANDCQFHMEVRTIGSALETRVQPLPDHPFGLVPTWNGQPRVNKPPLAVWITLLAWHGLPPDAPVDTLVLRARWAGVLFALLTLLATAWAGRTLVHIRFGLAAAAVTGSSLFFLRQLRLATYDTYLLAFCTLTVAAGLWALQPARPAERTLIHRWGWLMAGLALGLAILAKGPLALLLAAAPLMLMVIITPDRRRHVVGLLIMLGVSALVALPWYLYILRTVPNAASLLLNEFEAERIRSQPPWYYLGLLGLVVPWTLWLVAGLVTSLRRPHPGAWSILRLAAGWFLFVLLALSIPEAKQQRYILPILPAAGLLSAGALWLGDTTRKGWRALAWTHTGLLSAASLAIAAFGFLPTTWTASLGLATAPHPGAGLALGLLLLGLAGAFLRLWRHGRTECALWLAVTWMTAAATPGLSLYAHSTRGHYVHRAEVEQVAALTRGQPFFHLTGPYTEPQYVHPDPRFRLYARRVVPGRDLDQIRQLTGPAWVTAPVHKNADRDLQRAGWTAVLDYQDKGPVRRLYHKDR